MGSIDIFWRDAEGLHLRDWKTSDERYSPSWYYERQLEFYAYALRRNSEKQKINEAIDSALIYLRSAESKKSPRVYSKTDFGMIGDAVETAAVRALSRDLHGTPERCAACPWSRECMENIRS